MRIEFDDGDSGFWEARMLYAITRRATAEARSTADLEFIDFLIDTALAHMDRAEFVELRAAARPLGHESWLMNLREIWRRLSGPSRLEAELSSQRGAALERAERAEHSAFEALAETARIGRERDEARAEIEKLKKALAKLEAELAGVGVRQPGD